MLRSFILPVLVSFYSFVAVAQQPFCSLAKSAALNPAIASPADVARMNGYDVYFYKLDVNVERNTLYISGNVEIHATAVKNLPEFVFELHDNLAIDSVMLNGARFAFTRAGSIVTVNTGTATPVQSRFAMVIYYHGFAPQGGTAAIGNGFSTSTQEVTWSLSQPYAAYEWWPCKQVLYDKADSADIWITTAPENKAGSNGLLVNTTTMPGGKKRYEWKTRYPIDYYLISVAVAKYTEYNLFAYPAGATQPVLVQNYIYDNGVKSVIDFTPGLIEMFSSFYGLYPFALEKYGHSQAPLGGGMEHQTMTTLGAFTYDIVAHELAHQWFGDYVTCGSWADIWLNEGFASYSEYVAEEHKPGGGNPSAWMSSTMAGAKNAFSSVYANDTQEVGIIFNGASTYNKGAVLLHMLRYEINNDSVFFLGLRNHLQAHRFATALGSDFKTTMEQTSGKDFGYFFDQWYHGLGYPVFSAKWNQINDKVFVNLTESTTNLATALFKTTIDIRLLFSGGGDTLVRAWVDSLSKVYTISVPGKNVSAIRIDPFEWILKDTGTIVKDPLFNAIPDVSKSGHDMLIYPNPAHDLLHVTYAKGSTIRLVDLAGRQYLDVFMNEENAVVELDQVPPGFYLVHIEKDGHTYISKMVKQ